MSTEKVISKSPEEILVSLKIKLATLWASFMFFIIYLDYFHLYMPGKIADIQTGEIFMFDITQGFLLIALCLVGVPALMIYLSVILPAKANRLANIIIAALNIPFVLFNLIGEAWAHMLVGAVIEVLLLCIIIYYSWKWPSVEK